MRDMSLYTELFQQHVFCYIQATQICIILTCLFIISGGKISLARIKWICWAGGRVFFIIYKAVRCDLPCWMSFISRWRLEIKMPTAWERLPSSNLMTWKFNSEKKNHNHRKAFLNNLYHHLRTFCLLCHMNTKTLKLVLCKSGTNQ